MVFPSKADAVIAELERLLADNPNDAVAHYHLGTTLASAGRIEDAVAHLRRAVDLKPDIVKAQVNLGLALNALRRPQEALEAFEAALALAPDTLAATYGAGLALRYLGRTDEARRHFERAVALAPDDSSLHFALAACARFTEGDTRLAPLETLAEKMSAMPVSARSYLHFALAKAYDELGRPAEAFDHFVRGNAIVRAMNGYDEASAHQIIAAMEAGYTAEAMAGLEGRGDPSELPVFIIGMPRSGTTLVEQVLNGHRNIVGAGEVHIFNQIVRNVLPEARKAFAPLELSGKALRQIGGRYVEALRALAPDAARIVNKLPGNFVYAGLIHLALPQARIIHVRRDPRDTCLSCFANLFAAGNAFTYDLAELGRYYRSYQRLMAHWKTVLPPDRLIEVDYEALVTNMPVEARRLVEFLGLEWDESCLDFHHGEGSVFTLSAYQVRQPVYASSIGRWRPYADNLNPLIDVLEQP